MSEDDGRRHGGGNGGGHGGGNGGGNGAAANPGAEKPRPSAPVRTARRCPICGRPATVGISPFCSRRCADVDLHRWLSEGYAVPVAPADDTPDSDGES
jgi:endogenous inhibitor of DNA gyrase (YacG/DUF329 family)